MTSTVNAVIIMCHLCLLTIVAGRKNVLFLVSDDMRPELGSYYGPDFPSPVHPKMHTPNLDSLAAKSLLLKRAYVQQAICSPSRTSLLTGRRPDTTHVYDLQHYFRKVGGNYTTIPQYFKQHGYTSIGMGKAFHAGPASGYDDPISWSRPYFHGIPNFENNDHSWVAVPDKKLVNKPLIDDQIARRAIETLRNLSSDPEIKTKPFFLAVGFHKPHLPFVFPESMLQYYPKDSISLPDNPYAPVDMPKIAWNHYSGFFRFKDLKALNASANINTTLPDYVVKELRRAYYSALSWTDLLIGRVLKELDNLGFSNNTIVSFWGDHGWQLGEHGEWLKMTNFELAVQAPMMVHIPGLTDGGKPTHQLAEFVDLFPTLAEAAELPLLPLCPEDSTGVETCREGTSLIPLITNPDKPVKKAAFSQYPRHTKNVPVMGYSMRTDRYRYTEWVKFLKSKYKPDWNKNFGIELYDHVNDPEENHNRAYEKNYESIRKQLSLELHKGWRASVDDGTLYFRSNTDYSRKSTLAPREVDL